MDKALVTLYPSATPSLAAPTLDRVRLPPALAQQMFPVSCGSDHKTEESEKAAASVLAIEGPKEEGDEEEEEGEVKPPASFMRSLVRDSSISVMVANKWSMCTPNEC